MSSIAYGNGSFVAVSAATSTQNGNPNDKAMTSPDGITWTSRTAAAPAMYGLVFGGSQFVAVGASGKVMTSPDGATWNVQASPTTNTWSAIAYGNGKFIAVAQSGTGNRVMTSPDGVNWTAGTSSADNAWTSVAFGNGTFVAVAATGTGNRVMTSPDGSTWTARNPGATAPAGNTASTGDTTGGGATSAPAGTLPTVPGTGRCKRVRCTTKGTIPTGATAITQVATNAGKRATGKCKIVKSKKKKGLKTYVCSIRLTKGTWTITTEARTGATVIARTVKTTKVK
jgi:hypothetical protein